MVEGYNSRVKNEYRFSCWLSRCSLLFMFTMLERMLEAYDKSQWSVIQSTSNHLYHLHFWASLAFTLLHELHGHGSYMRRIKPYMRIELFLFPIMHIMSTSIPRYPKVDLLYWTASQIYVICPYCEEIHYHGVKLPGKRLSHCHPGGRYGFILPINESRRLVGYEIG